MKLDSDTHGPEISTINSEIFVGCIFSRIEFKDIFTTLKIMTRAWFTYISKQQNDHHFVGDFP